MNNAKTNQSIYGLLPVGTFITRTNLSDSIPVRLCGGNGIERKYMGFRGGVCAAEGS